MEKFTVTKNSKKYGLTKGETFKVFRNIMGECVVIRNPEQYNLIFSEKKLSTYGDLEGVPYIYDVGPCPDMKQGFKSGRKSTGKNSGPSR